MGKPFEQLKSRIAPASPLHISAANVLSPSIINVAMNSMALQQHSQPSLSHQNSQQQIDLNSLALLNNGASTSGPTSNLLTNGNMNSLLSLQQMLVQSGQLEAMNGLTNALNSLQQNGQNGQQQLLNALNGHQPPTTTAESETTGPKGFMMN